MADGMMHPDLAENGSQTESQDLSIEPQTPLETFKHDWYIRVKVDCRGVTKLDRARLTVDIGEKVVTLFEGLKSQLGAYEIHMVPKRLVDSADDTSARICTCYWLIGLPTIPSAELGKSRQFLREWQEDANGEALGKAQGVKKTVQSKFIPKKLLLQQDLKEDVETGPESKVEHDPNDGIEGSGESFKKVLEINPARAESDLKYGSPQSGESFKKTPGSNPAQVRRQFLQHAMKQSRDEGRNSQASIKLRPAKEVLNRLKYDSGYKPHEYVVGYIDRRAGILEMPVHVWEKYEQDELIAYFKHVPKDLIVWDRARKIDWIFNTRPN